MKTFQSIIHLACIATLFIHASSMHAENISFKDDKQTLVHWYEKVCTTQAAGTAINPLAIKNGFTYFFQIKETINIAKKPGNPMTRCYVQIDDLSKQYVLEQIKKFNTLTLNDAITKLEESVKKQKSFLASARFFKRPTEQEQALAKEQIALNVFTDLRNAKEVSTVQQAGDFLAKSGKLLAQVKK